MSTEQFLKDYVAGTAELEGDPSSGFWTCPDCGSDKFHNCEGCPDCGLSDEDARYFGQHEFDTSPCDVCGTHLAGYRETVIGWLKGARENGFTEDYEWSGEICTDCLVFAANGDLPQEG